MQYIDWLEPTIEIAHQAGAKILEVYDGELAINYKDDQSPLTAADLASHNSIINDLTQLTPDIPILSEESAEVDWEVRRDWNPFWLVDPLDGTKEFIKRNGEFTVNIALIHQHRPVLGVVHVPVSSTTYFGGRNAGAHVLRDNKKFPISVRPCAQKPVVVGSRSHRGASLEAFLRQLGDHELTAMGSSLKLCLVAEGAADLYPRLGPTSEWDTAAAHAVVEAAGGQVLDVQGNDVNYNAKESILNPHFMVIGDNSVNWHQYLKETDELPQQ